MAPTFVSTVALGKRRQEGEEHHGDKGPVVANTCEMPLQKRARSGATEGILKAARSAARTRHKPVARTPMASISDTPKDAGHGAERLATLNTQGICHQPLLGPSIQQGWAVQDPDGKLIWVEGRVEEEAMHHIRSTVQQQQGKEEEEEKVEHFRIPRIFKPEHREFLVATEVDLARGVVQHIKCQLCPDTTFKTWEDFKRHCNTTETHPLKINFCDWCGDFFARRDALVRHHQHPPPECIGVTSEAAAIKRRETEKAHSEFVGRLMGCLKTGENIGKPFSQIIKEKYPGSSKKRMNGSKEGSRLKRF